MGVYLEDNDANEDGLYPIRYIDNPSEKVKFASVKENPMSIKHIDNPSESTIGSSD